MPATREAASEIALMRTVFDARAALGSPRSGDAGVSPEALADPRRIADAVRFLANQDARSATHELQLTPLAENWTP
jgi:NADP-dependent 3-hydroxy acid dehydrogenase YdfG